MFLIFLQITLFFNRVNKWPIFPRRMEEKLKENEKRMKKARE